MLSKYMVQSLRDLTLEQLPGTKALSRKLYTEHGNGRAALQAVAWAPVLLINSPLSTSLEILAGRLLALIGQHPCTHTEYLIDKMDGDDGLCMSVEDAVLWAEQDRPYIEEALLETARQLCEISGANLPPWMNAINGQFASQQSPATLAPAAKTKAKRRTWWDVSSAYIIQVMRTGQHATAKELYRDLEAKTGPNTPFDKGTGASRGRLFVREIAQSLSLKTVQNKWEDLTKAAASK